MRHPQTGKRKRKDQIGWSKVLTPREQEMFWQYLRGDVRSALNKKFINLEAVSTKRLLLICDLFFHTGLRVTELISLKVQDTPAVLGQNVIEVYRGKNDKDRTVPVSQRLADHISEYIKDTRPRTMPRYVRRSDITKPIFYSQSRQPYTQQIKVVNNKTGIIQTRIRASSALYRTIRQIGEHAGIAKCIHPHMFRHTFAVNALMAGVDIYLLQQLMGHSNITDTARYLHIVNAQLKGLGEKLDLSVCH